MPKFIWNPDPVAIGFTLNFLYAMIGLAIFAAIGFYTSRRNDDQGGAYFSAALAVGALILGLMWSDWHPWVQIRYYSLLFVVVFLGGYSLLNWQIRRGGGGPEEAGDFIIYGVVGVLAGARLGHIIFYEPRIFLDNPIEVLYIWKGGLASHGATIGLIVAMWLFTAKRRIPFLEGADRFSFSAALGAALVRLGNFMNSEIVGREIAGGSWGVWFKKTCETRPDGTFGCWQILGHRAADWADKCPTGGTDCWGMDEAEIYRHPSQLYEVALGLAVLAALLIFDRALGKEKRPRGALISLFFVLYFVGRFIVEFFKEYQTNLQESHMLTMGQWLSIPGVLLGIYGLTWAFRTRQPTAWKPKRQPRRAAFDDDDDDFDDDDDDDNDDDFDDDEPRRRSRKSRTRTAKKKSAKKKSAKKKSVKKKPAVKTRPSSPSDTDDDDRDRDDDDRDRDDDDDDRDRDDDDDDRDDDDDDRDRDAAPGAPTSAGSRRRRQRRRARAEETSVKPAADPAGRDDEDDDRDDDEDNDRDDDE